MVAYSTISVTLLSEQRADGIDPVIKGKLFNVRVAKDERRPNWVGMLPVKEFTDTSRYVNEDNVVNRSSVPAN